MLIFEKSIDFKVVHPENKEFILVTKDESNCDKSIDSILILLLSPSLEKYFSIFVIGVLYCISNLEPDIIFNSLLSVFVQFK